LAWHPEHLVAALEGRKPPQVGDPAVTDHDVPGHLAAIERRLQETNDMSRQQPRTCSVALRWPPKGAGFSSRGRAKLVLGVAPVDLRQPRPVETPARWVAVALDRDL
jgi:hypothetical protein